MKCISRVCTLIFAIALMASCSSLPKSTHLAEGQADMRAEYLANHPDGKYNSLISEGRVVKGMGVVEVLASWGLPNQRAASKKDDAEFWTYYAKDEYTGQMVSYELIFEEQALTRWVVGTDAVAGLGNDPGPAVNRSVEETLKLGQATGGTDSSAPKKK